MNWMISANIAKYDLKKAFSEERFVDWHYRVDFKVGDVVYIYCTKPYQKVMFKTQIEKVNLNRSGIRQDDEYWTDEELKEKVKSEKYARLRFVDHMDDDKLHLSKLLENGLSVAPRGPIRVVSELEEYIDSVFEEV